MNRYIDFLDFLDIQQQTLAFPFKFFCQPSRSMELHEKIYTNDSSSLFDWRQPYLITDRVIVRKKSAVLSTKA